MKPVSKIEDFATDVLLDGGAGEMSPKQKAENKPAASEAPAKRRRGRPAKEVEDDPIAITLSTPVKRSLFIRLNKVLAHNQNETGKRITPTSYLAAALEKQLARDEKNV